MRRASLLLLILLTLTQVACSYLTDFVIVNSSGSVVEVRYQIRAGPQGQWSLPGRPAKIPASQLGRGGNGWVQLELPADQYRIDDISRTVTLSLGPEEALRIATLHNYGGTEDDAERDYPIEQVTIVGAGGEMRFTGRQARLAFSVASDDTLYTLTYK
jgi:hypothetical protein